MQEQVRCLMLTAPALIVNMMNFYRSKVAHDMSLELARTLDEPRQPPRASFFRACFRGIKMPFLGHQNVFAKTLLLSLLTY